MRSTLTILRALGGEDLELRTPDWPPEMLTAPYHCLIRQALDHYEKFKAAWGEPDAAMCGAYVNDEVVDMWFVDKQNKLCRMVHVGEGLKPGDERDGYVVVDAQQAMTLVATDKQTPRRIEVR